MSCCEFSRHAVIAELDCCNSPNQWQCQKAESDNILQLDVSYSLSKPVDIGDRSVVVRIFLFFVFSESVVVEI